jgi:hypothetical protein
MDVTDRLFQLADILTGTSRSTVESLASELVEEFDSLQVTLDLENMVELTMHLHPWNEHTWVYRHTYRRANETNIHSAPLMLCEWACTVGYSNGVIQPIITIAMHIIIPERLGKAYAYGMDISPGAKTFLEFIYVQQPEGHFLLSTVQKGCQPKVNLDQGKGLMQPVEFPFPVPDRIQRPRHENGTIWGDYEVSYLYTDPDTGLDCVGYLSIPHTQRRAR